MEQQFVNNDLVQRYATWFYSIDASTIIQLHIHRRILDLFSNVPLIYMTAVCQDQQEMIGATGSPISTDAK